MASDDLTAFATISMGALVSAALTVSLMSRDVDVEIEPEPSIRLEVLTRPAPAGARPETARRIIDYAIIRGDVETMVGPGDIRSGWSPPPRELFPRRGR